MQSWVLATIIVVVVLILCCVCIGVALHKNNRAWRKREEEKFRDINSKTQLQQHEDCSARYIS